MGIIIALATEAPLSDLNLIVKKSNNNGKEYLNIVYRKKSFIKVYIAVLSIFKWKIRFQTPFYIILSSF